MDAAKGTNIVCAFVAMLAICRVGGQYDSKGASDVVEGPRVERMQPESGSSVNCGSGNCVTLRNSDSPLGGLWFGPRLGRKRRSDAAKLSTTKMQALGEILAAGTWGKNPMESIREQGAGEGVSGQREGMISGQQQPQDDKRQETTFTPRLGRELDDFLSTVALVRDVFDKLDQLSRRFHSDHMVPVSAFNSEWEGKRGRDLISPEVRAKLGW